MGRFLAHSDGCESHEETEIPVPEEARSNLLARDGWTPVSTQITRCCCDLPKQTTLLLCKHLSQMKCQTYQGENVT